MIIHKGHEFRLELSIGQVSDMNRFAGHNRAVWNRALEITKDRLEQKVPIMWFYELNWALVSFWKKSDEMSWLMNIFNGRACRYWTWRALAKASL